LKLNERKDKEPAMAAQSAIRYLISQGYEYSVAKNAVYQQD